MAVCTIYAPADVRGRRPGGPRRASQHARGGAPSGANGLEEAAVGRQRGRGEMRGVVASEDAAGEFLAGAHVGLAAGGLDVLLHGVDPQAECPSDRPQTWDDRPARTRSAACLIAWGAARPSYFPSTNLVPLCPRRSQRTRSPSPSKRGVTFFKSAHGSTTRRGPGPALLARAVPPAKRYSRTPRD